MKEIDYKDAPDVGGGYEPSPEGGCFPPLDYPRWPLAPEPFPDLEPRPMPSDTDVR
jgi:hypothetical protein